MKSVTMASTGTHDRGYGSLLEDENAYFRKTGEVRHSSQNNLMPFKRCPKKYNNKP
jgi:hypothetical protein